MCDIFTTNGATEGPCGHSHRSAESASKCLRGDRLIIRNGSTFLHLTETGRWLSLSEIGYSTRLA